MVAQPATASFSFPVFCIKQEKIGSEAGAICQSPGEEFSTPGTGLVFDSQHWKADPAIQEATGTMSQHQGEGKNHP